MKVRCDGTAEFHGRESGAVYLIAASDLDWEISFSEKEGQNETVFKAKIEFGHPREGTVIWELSEFPPGIQNFAHTFVEGVIEIQDLNYFLIA